jgi:hypothetical protein
VFFNRVNVDGNCYRYLKFTIKVTSQFLFLSYVRWIKKKSVNIKEPWPSGICHGTSADPASELLAQLEERWLGLER